MKRKKWKEERYRHMQEEGLGMVALGVIKEAEEKKGKKRRKKEKKNKKKIPVGVKMEQPDPFDYT